MAHDHSNHYYGTHTNIYYLLFHFLVNGINSCSLLIDMLIQYAFKVVVDDVEVSIPIIMMVYVCFL